MGITTLAELSDYLAEMMTSANLQLIEAKTKNHGHKEARYASAAFVARFIGTVLYKTLTEEVSVHMTKDQKDLYIMKNVAEFKAQIQEAVAGGFQNAMSEFAGHPIEYYCQIKPVPEPISNKVN